MIEKADGNDSAYVSDRPDCVATVATIPEVEAEIRKRDPLSCRRPKERMLAHAVECPALPR